MSSNDGARPDMVAQAAGILTEAGHADAGNEIRRVADANQVHPDDLAEAIVEVSQRRRADDQPLADVIRLHWREVVPEG